MRGFLTLPGTSNHCGLVLTHGAGANCDSPLLQAIAAGFAGSGYTVLRCDLPFRQKRRGGPPRGSSDEDRAGLRSAMEALLAEMAESNAKVFLAGHSYGGRQASMLAAEHPGLAAGLLLLSYPLHPPEKPLQLRTAHFPQLHTPAMFVHGTRDPFAAIPELENAIQLIPARTRLLPVEGAGHDLLGRRAEASQLPAAIVRSFGEFAAGG
ncbi:MAG: alpha/beta fold hydrolase [Acidobacteria bacterium]|nr:alpha/beta fold hydrolase [Acidobacteriota bacterium]